MKIVIGFMLLVFINMNYFNCSSAQNGSSAAAFIMQEDTIILIHNEYFISVPNIYHLRTGLGDDTEFLQIKNEGQSLIIQYEIGPGVKQKNMPLFLKGEDVQVKTTKKFGEGIIKIAYQKTESQLRDLEGEVFIQEKGSFKYLFSFSCNPNQLNNITSILNSLSQKTN